MRIFWKSNLVSRLNSKTRATSAIALSLMLMVPLAANSLSADGSDYPIIVKYPDACVAQYSVTGGSLEQRETMESIFQGVASMAGVPTQNMGSNYPQASDVNSDYIYRIRIDSGYSSGNAAGLATPRVRGAEVRMFQSAWSTGIFNLGPHEIGHAFGLEHNPSESNGMMTAPPRPGNNWTPWELTALRGNTVRMRNTSQCWLSPDADRSLVGGSTTTSTPTTPTTKPTNSVSSTVTTSAPVTTQAPVTTRITTPTTVSPTTPTVTPGWGSYDDSIIIYRTGPVKFGTSSRYRYIVQNKGYYPLTNILILDKAASRQGFNYVATIPFLSAGKTTVILSEPLAGEVSGLPCQAYYIPLGAKTGKGVACR